MFEKLLSNLPYNPGVLHQIGFYAQRMRREQSIRRLGLVFVVLAFFVQFFAVMSPPQSSVADSNNDLINGGINSVSGAVSACTSNVAHYADILAYYGISCSDVASATTVSLKSTDYNKQLFSMGRLNYPIAGETPVSISGSTYYLRYLWGWDTGAYSTYQALKFTSSKTGVTYFILYNCGNLVSVGLPKQYIPPPPPPTVKPCQYNSSLPASSPQCFPPCQYNSGIPATSSECKPCEKSISSTDTLACIAYSKTASDPTQGWSDANGQTAKPGDTLVYTLYAKNNGKAVVKDFLMQESLSDVLDYADVVSLDGGTIDNTTGIVTWPKTDIAAGDTLKHQITVKVKDPVPQTPASSSDPGHFDLTMVNTYGNTITIKVPGSPTKVIETASTQLVNTGPGSSLMIAGAIAILAGYFFARTRLLATESKIAMQETANGSV